MQSFDITPGNLISEYVSFSSGLCEKNKSREPKYDK